MRQDTVQMEPTARWTRRLMHRPLINNAHSDLLILHTHTVCSPTRACSPTAFGAHDLPFLMLSDVARLGGS
jgi:hypothetical protein